MIQDSAASKERSANKTMRLGLSRCALSLLLFVLSMLCVLKSPSYAGKDQVVVIVDPRIELLSAVQLLSDYSGLTRYQFQYKQDMAAYFAPYKNHRAVEVFRRMSSRWFAYNLPPEVMLCLSDPPALQPNPEFQTSTRRIATQHGGGPQGMKEVEEFVDALRDFARVSNFQGFYDAHRDTYRQMVDDVQSKLDGVDVVGPLEDYYGHTGLLKCTIVLAPLFHMGGYGATVERADGVRELYDICGPCAVQQAASAPAFGDADNIQELAWHEMGHSFVNPVSSKHLKELSRYSSLLTPIHTIMRLQAYKNWKTCVDEHLVRAVEARIIFRQKGQAAYERVIGSQRARGFVYIVPLCKRLEGYEKHRDRYPTFASFYPCLVAEFKSLSKQKLGPDFYRVNMIQRIGFYAMILYFTQPHLLAILLAAIVIPPTVSAAWAVRDARKRNRRWWPVAILVLFGIWPVGFIVWLFLRRRG